MREPFVSHEQLALSGKQQINRNSSTFMPLDIILANIKRWLLKLSQMLEPDIFRACEEFA